MMKLKTLLVPLFAAAVLCGGTAEFRGGRILCAELSRKDPAPAVTGKASVRHPDLPLPSDRIYAAVTFKGHDGRKLSIHDYGLESYGRVYPCVAFRKNGGAFVDSVGETQGIDPKARYTLLFILDSKVVGQNKTEELDVKALFPPEKLSRSRVPFENLGEGAFTAPGAIPESGRVAGKK